MEATPEVTHGIPLGFVLTCISGLWKKNRTVFFSFGVKIYLNYRLVLCTIFQPWAFCLRCCCLLFWKGLWSQASHHNFCVHYRTFPELESIRLPVPAAVAAAAHFIDLFGNLFSAARLLQTKPFSSDSFDFQPNFILYSCRRHMTSPVRRMPGHVQRAADSPPSTWLRQRPVCKYTAQSHRTLKPHCWPLCKFWVLCWELSVTAALREKRRPWV